MLLGRVASLWPIEVAVKERGYVAEAAALDGFWRAQTLEMEAYEFTGLRAT